MDLQVDQVTGGEVPAWVFEGRRVLESEGSALLALSRGLDLAAFRAACDLLFDAPPPAIVTGMGKSGHIARKVAATLASTGTPAFYLHPAEALHGDLGSVTPKSAVIAFSHSGSSEEVLSLLPYLRGQHARLVAITGEPASPLARAAEVVLTTGVEEEACPLNLAPTTSTTAQLAMGDALAMALMRRRGFEREDFAIRHPLGSLGRRLVMRVEDLMKRGGELPAVGEAAPLSDAIDAMNRGRLGCVAVTDAQGRLAGIFTDGDLRRLWVKARLLDATVPVGRVMVANPKRVHPGVMAVRAVDLMEQYKITVLPVVGDDDRLVGMVHLHDLVALGLA